ncbi:MAG: hypothetical protein Q4A60_01485 [Pasteurellaceae bacterium]|nr:hypothetical protein [Pasteurellaceae bacterium]
MTHLLVELIGELFKWLMEAIWERYPTTSKVIYGGTFGLFFLYFWLFDDEMAWWSAGIFAVFLSLIVGTLLVILLHLGVKWCYKGSD